MNSNSNSSSSNSTSSNSTSSNSSVVVNGGSRSPGADEHREHQFVKIAEQLTENVTRPASTKFEVILENFDKIRAIKKERKLTKSEQRIYDKVHRYVKSEFDAMFKRAEPMVSELRKRAASVQRGGQPTGDVSTAPATAAPATAAPATAAPAAAEAQTPAAAAAPTVGAEAQTPAAAPTAGAAAPTAGTTRATASTKVQGAPIETQTQNAGTQATEMTSAATQTKTGTPWAENFRFLIWIWDGIKYVFTSIISFFTNTVDDKMRALMKYFSVENLLSMLGNNLEKIEGLKASIAEQITELQKSIVGGISGAATASIDMILNAFSMMPVIGTTILVWRMFQNMLVIMGATLSVQAGKTTASNAVAVASGANYQDAVNANKTIDSATPGTSGTGGEFEVKDAHKAVEGGGKRIHSKEGPAKRQMARTLKKSTTNFKRSLKRFVELRPAPLITMRGGGGDLYSVKRELARGSKYAAASGLFSGYAAL